MMLLFLVEEQVYTFFHDFKSVNIDLENFVFCDIMLLNIGEYYVIRGGACGDCTVRRVDYTISDGQCIVGDKVFKVMSDGDVDFSDEAIPNVSAKNVLALQDKSKQLEDLLSQLKTNENVDWSIEDANWEFMTLSKTLMEILDIHEDCEDLTMFWYEECSSIDNGRWHNETLQELGDDYYVHPRFWDIQENGVAIDCYGKELEPEDDGGGYTYLWLHGAGWTDELVREVIECELYEKHPVYLIKDRGYILCGNWVYPVHPTGLINFDVKRLSECIFDYPDCIGTVHCLCEGGE